MVHSIIRSALFAFIVAAVSATPRLSLRVTGPESVTDVATLQITVTLVNTGDEALRLLNAPGGPLSKLPTDSFAISNSVGKAPEFIGIRAKYVPSNVVATGNSGAFTILAPGESVTVAHDREPFTLVNIFAK
jgi:peptidyl-Lys metalloendopeptidase